MSHAPGTHLGGIRSVEDLRLRCHVDDATGCWRWRGASTRGRPNLWLPALGRRTTIGSALRVLLTGELLFTGVVWHRNAAVCAHLDCANPAHHRAGDRVSQMRGARRAPQAVLSARAAHARQGKSRLSPEALADIRGSTEPLKVLCARHGISMSYASVLRSGRYPRPPLAPNASVFAWGSHKPASPARKEKRT